MSEPAVAVTRQGDLLEVLDAFGVWHRAVAVSEVEGTHENGRKVHDFPVVWVVVLNERTAELLAAGDEPSRIPWPFDAVRPSPPGEPDDMTAFAVLMDGLSDDQARRHVREAMEAKGWRLRDDLSAVEREEAMRREFERLGGEEAWANAVTLDQINAHERAEGA